MKNIFLFVLLVMVTACKNPFTSGEDTPVKSTEGFSIQNTENGSVLLRLNPQVGDKTMVTMAVDVEPGKMLIPLDTHFVGDLKLSVTESNDAENVYTVDFQRIQLDTKVMGAKIAYDSQQENHNLPSALQQEMESILAKKVTLRLDSLAQMKALEFDGNTKNLATSAIDLNTLFIPLPQKPVQVGDSWLATQGGKNMEGKELTYTVKKISDTEVLVHLHATNDKIKGMYLIDRKTGFTKKADLQISADEDGLGVHVTLSSKS